MPHLINNEFMQLQNNSDDESAAPEAPSFEDQLDAMVFPEDPIIGSQPDQEFDQIIQSQEDALREYGQNAPDWLQFLENLKSKKQYQIRINDCSILCLL